MAANTSYLSMLFPVPIEKSAPPTYMYFIGSLERSIFRQSSTEFASCLLNLLTSTQESFQPISFSEISEKVRVLKPTKNTVEKSSSMVSSYYLLRGIDPSPELVYRSHGTYTWPSPIPFVGYMMKIGGVPFSQVVFGGTP